MSLVHLMLSFSISYLDLIKFHDFADNSQERIEASNERCNSGPTGHDFTTDNSNTPYVMPFDSCASFIVQFYRPFSLRVVHLLVEIIDFNFTIGAWKVTTNY
jgi:hypothetical protein